MFGLVFVYVVFKIKYMNFSNEYEYELEQVRVGTRRTGCHNMLTWSACLNKVFYIYLKRDVFIPWDNHIASWLGGVVSKSLQRTQGN